MAEEEEEPKTVIGRASVKAASRDDPSPYIGSAVASSEHAKRIAERERAVARRRAELASAEAREARIRAQIAKEEDDLALTRQGLRRSFWTGRVIPVRGSRRARAHNRRLKRASYG